MISIFKLETYAKIGNTRQQFLFLSPSLSLFPDDLLMCGLMYAHPELPPCL